jgi:hypothetical protein
MKVTDVVQTCEACPSQWDAKTEDGKYVYIRYRWGSLTVDIDGHQYLHVQRRDFLDGIISWEEVEEYLEKIQYPAERDL